VDREQHSTICNPSTSHKYLIEISECFVHMQVSNYLGDIQTAEAASKCLSDRCKDAGSMLLGEERTKTTESLQQNLHGLHRQDQEMIFRHINLVDIVSTFPNLPSRLCEAALAAHVDNGRLSLDLGDNASLTMLTAHLCKLPEARHLTVNLDGLLPDLSDALGQAILSMPSLRSLEITTASTNRSWGYAQSVPVVSSFSQHLPGLAIEEMTLRSPTEAIMADVVRLTTLTRLEVADMCPALFSDRVEHFWSLLAATLGALPRLRTLGLSEINRGVLFSTTTKHASCFAERLSPLTALEHLNLASVGLVDATLTASAAKLLASSHLSYLDLSANTALTHRAAQALGPILSAHPTATLRHLNLSRVNFEAQGAAALTPALRT
jgi:hypothetical protein